MTQGKIKREFPHKDQVRALLMKSDKDITVAKLIFKIDYETSFKLSYDSMLKAGRALMLSKGYRTTDGEQHKTTVEFCWFFIDRTLVVQFDHMRRDRNTLSYDPYYCDEINEGEASHAVESAERFLAEVKRTILA